MRYQFRYCTRYDKDLHEFLNKQNIKCDPTGGFIVFYLYDRNGETLALREEIKERFKKEEFVLHVSSEYTVSEINRASFLTLRAVKPKIDIVNETDAYMSACTYLNPHGLKKAGHMTQVKPFYIKKAPPSTTSTAFWSDCTDSKLFADHRVKDIVSKTGAQGFVFDAVFLKNGIMSQEIFQLKSSNVLGKDDFAFGFGEELYRCHLCGKEKFFIPDTVQLHLKLTADNLKDDLYMSDQIFGAGIPSSVYLISQRFYRELKQNRLTGGLRVTPVILNH